MQGIVDRIEGKYVVVELDEGVFTEVLLADFPEAPGEGDTVDLDSKAIISVFNKDDLSAVSQYFK